MKNSILFTLVSIFVLSSTMLFSQNNDSALDSISNVEKNHPLLSNKFTFYAGVYSSTKGIKIGVNGSSDNEIISFNEKADFNENEKTLFLNFNWRFSKMWSLSAEYFSVKNGIRKTIDGNFEWKDQIFNGGAEVKLGLNLNMYRVFIGRIISKGQKYELGAGLGSHVLDVKTYIEGFAYVNNEETGQGAETNFERSSVDVVAPLPNIGAWYFYAPTQKWMFTARVDWFGLTVGDYSGSLWDLGGGANYQFHKHFGVGLKYRYFDFTAKVNTANWNGDFSLIFQGPLLTVNANF